MDFLNGITSFNSENASISAPKDYSNLAMMENYGKNTMQNPSDPNFVTNILQWSYDYDYSQIPASNSSYDTNSFWDDLANPVKEGGAFVWDTAKGTWDTVKSTVVESASDLANAVNSAGTKIGENLIAVGDGILQRIILILIVLVGAFWILAKAGVIHDVASVFRP